MATYYWVGGSGTWDNASTTNWSATSGGANGAGPPLAADNAIFDANSGTTATVTVTGTAASTAVTVNKADINLNLTGDPTFGGTFTLTTGTVTLNAQTLTVQTFTSNNTNTRAIAWGTGKMVLTGNATTIFNLLQTANYTSSGTPLIESNYSGGTGTRTVNISSTGSKTVSFTNTAAATDTLTITGEIGNVDLSLFAGTLTNTTRSVYGSWTNGTSMTITAGSNITSWASDSTFAPTGITTVTSNGKEMPPFTVTVVSGTVKFADAYTLHSSISATCTILSGTLDLNNQTLTCNDLSITGSTTRSIAFGTGKIALRGTNATIWNGATLTNFTYTGTPSVELTYTGSTNTRTIDHGVTAGATEANAISISNVAAATDTLSIQGSFLNVNLGSFAGTFSNNTRTLYGNWTNSSAQTNTSGSLVMTFAKTSGTQTVTSSGKEMQPFTINSAGTTVTLADAYTLFTASITTLTLTIGTLNLNNQTLTCWSFTSSNANTRNITFGTGKIVLTGNNTTIWNLAITSGLTVTNTPTLEVSYTGGTGTRTLVTGTTGGTEARSFSLSTVAASTDSLSIQGVWLNVNLTGFAGTLANVARTLYGNWTNGTGQTNTAGNSVMTFAKASGTQTVTSAGKQMQPFTINSAGTTVTLADAYSQFTSASTTSCTLTTGTLNLNDQTLSIHSLALSGTTTRSIAFGVGKIVLIGSNSTIWNGATLTSFSLTGTPTVEATSSSAVGTRIFNHGATTPGNVTGQDAIAVSLTVNLGSDTFSLTNNSHINDLDFTGFNNIVSNSTTFVYGNVNLGSTATFTVSNGTFTFQKTAAGTQTLTTNGRTCRNITVVANTAGTVQLIDNLTVAAAGTLGVTLTSGTFDLTNKTVTTPLFTSNNSNVRALTFGTTGKIILTLANATIWGCANAANLTLNGTSYVESNAAGAAGNNRAVTNATTGGGQAQAINFYVTAGAGSNVSTSGRFNNLIFSAGTSVLNSGNSTIYGNFTLNTGMTVSDSAVTTTFAGTSGTQTITTNGVTFNQSITVNSSSTVSLADALTLGANDTFTVTAGTFQTNSFNLTAGTIAFSGSTARTINLGTSTITASAAGTSFTLADATNLTLNYSAGCTFSLTAATAKNITTNTTTLFPPINNGGAGALTITATSGQTINLTNLSSTYAVATGANTITLTAGATYTFTSTFSLAGASGRLVTLNSSVAGTQANLRKDTPWYIGANSTIGTNSSGFSATTVSGYTANFISTANVNGALTIGQDGFFIFLGA